MSPAKRAARITMTPDPPALPLRCPRCNLALVYRHSVIGGVQPIERWDHFDCRTCGQFVYRPRTRKLRPAM